eukprot:4449700-Karenia_brevis.AAC.1
MHDWSGTGVFEVPAEPQQTNGDMMSCRFTLTSRLVALGTCLTVDADPNACAEYALSRARTHWICRKSQLCRKRVPLSKRIRRYYGTVGLTALHGQEGNPITQNVLKAYQSFDRGCLRSMLCMRKRTDESWQAFKKRQNKLLRRVLSKMGLQELAARLLNKHYGWCGHVMRMGSDHIAREWANTCTTEDWRLAQVIGNDLDPSNTTGWRHSQTGPFTRWDSLISNVM